MPRHKKKKRVDQAGGSAKRTDWVVGDLVVAKLRGHRPWPAQIQKPEDYGYTPRAHRIFVTFYGTEETCFCSYNKITPFTAVVRKGLAEQLQKINTNPELERAIKEIFAADDEHKQSLKLHGSIPKEDENVVEKSEDESPPENTRKRPRAVEEPAAADVNVVECRPVKHEKSVSTMAVEQVQKLPRKVRIKVSSQSSDSANHSSSAQKEQISQVASDDVRLVAEELDSGGARSKEVSVGVKDVDVESHCFSAGKEQVTEMDTDDVGQELDKKIAHKEAASVVAKKGGVEIHAPSAERDQISEILTEDLVKKLVGVLDNSNALKAEASVAAKERDAGLGSSSPQSKLASEKNTEIEARQTDICPMVADGEGREVVEEVSTSALKEELSLVAKGDREVREVTEDIDSSSVLKVVVAKEDDESMQVLEVLEENSAPKQEIVPSSMLNDDAGQVVEELNSSRALKHEVSPVVKVCDETRKAVVELDSTTSRQEETSVVADDGVKKIVGTVNSDILKKQVSPAGEQEVFNKDDEARQAMEVDHSRSITEDVSLVAKVDDGVGQIADAMKISIAGKVEVSPIVKKDDTTEGYVDMQVVKSDLTVCTSKEDVPPVSTKDDVAMQGAEAATIVSKEDDPPVSKEDVPPASKEDDVALQALEATRSASKLDVPQVAKEYDVSMEVVEEDTRSVPKEDVPTDADQGDSRPPVEVTSSVRIPAAEDTSSAPMPAAEDTSKKDGLPIAKRDDLVMQAVEDTSSAKEDVLPVAKQDDVGMPDIVPVKDDVPQVSKQIDVVVQAVEDTCSALKEVGSPVSKQVDEAKLVSEDIGFAPEEGVPPVAKQDDDSRQAMDASVVSNQDVTPASIAKQDEVARQAAESDLNRSASKKDVPTIAKQDDKTLPGENKENVSQVADQNDLDLNAHKENVSQEIAQKGIHLVIAQEDVSLVAKQVEEAKQAVEKSESSSAYKEEGPPVVKQDNHDVVQPEIQPVDIKAMTS